MLSRRPTKRPLVVTRSTFIGVGTKAAHWLGDNGSSWDAYRTSIQHMLQFTAFFQVPIVGADVRLLGRYEGSPLCSIGHARCFLYILSQSHSAPIQGQEFYRWPLVAEAARNAISIRYRFPDYFYTAFHKQSVDGTPVLSPIWCVPAPIRFLPPHHNGYEGVADWFSGFPGAGSAACINYGRP